MAILNRRYVRYSARLADPSIVRYNAQKEIAMLCRPQPTGPLMQEINQYLAVTLRQLRNDRGWSLDRAASECGVSKAMLGLAIPK